MSPNYWGKNEMKRNDDFYNRGISVSFFSNDWEMENKMQFMNDWQGPLTPRRCKKASLRLRNERSQTRQ